MASTKDVDAVVSQRLKSSWGRCTSDTDKKWVVSGLLPELHRLINAVDADDTVSWDTVVDRCHSHPSEVTRLDRRGRTCLSAACAKNAPPTVIKSMLPEACRLGHDAFLRDKTGMTAMTVSISKSASLEVVRLLMRNASLVTTSDHRGNTPLHLACQYQYRHPVDKLVALLLKACPCLAGRENSAGKTPLHVAIKNRASLDVVRMLVEGKKTARLVVYVSLHSFASSHSYVSQWINHSISGIGSQQCLRTLSSLLRH